MILSDVRVPRRGIRTFRTLLLSIFALLSASCASETLTPLQQVLERAESFASRVDTSIKDPARAERVHAVLTDVSAAFERRATELEEAQAQLREAAKDYETTEADLRKSIALIMSEGVELRNMLEQAHFEVRDLTTREEWDEITKQDSRFLGIF